VIAAEFSLFGETSGTIQTQKDWEVNCGIVCGGWPGFAFGDLARGWTIKFICLKRNNPWSDFIRIWFPNSIILIVDDNLSPSIVQQGMSVWFSDIDLPRSLQ
jgi:hypothetical protein